MELNCIKCGERTAIQMDATTGDDFHCPSCDADFTAEEVEAVIGDWQKVIAWVKLHPARQPERSEPSGDPITDRIIRSVRSG